MAEDIIIGKKYMSNSYGPFVVLEDLGCIKKDIRNSNRYYKIQFEWSTCINIVNKRNMLDNSVGDPWYGINPNIIQWSNNYGPFKILEFIKGSRSGKDFTVPKALIQFIKTNNTKIVDIDSIKGGDIVDETLNLLNTPLLDTALLQPNIREYRIKKFIRKIYRFMKDRCYNSNIKKYQSYGAMGVRVCDRWLESFDNFYNDAQSLSQYNKFERWPTLYQLDKDWIQYQQGIPKEQRIYSPEACMFLYNMDNNNLRIIEHKQNHINKLSSQYYGVSINSNGNYVVHITINSKNKHYGTFINEIAAANAYNYFYEHINSFISKRYELIPLHNDVPYMSLNMCMQYRIPPLKPLYTLTNESTISIPEFIEKYKVTKDDILS